MDRSSDRLPDRAPSGCPGTESDQAGRTAACVGCPNQSICASAPAGPDPDLVVIADNLERVRRIVLVMSGKGGVGKSSVCAFLAQRLATLSPPDAQCSGNGADAVPMDVGLLDVDLCGPSQARIFAVEGQGLHRTASGWSPVYTDSGVALVSIAFLLSPGRAGSNSAAPPPSDDAVILRGDRKTGLIKQFLRDVQWDQLDCLLVDTPPGTSDEHLALAKLLPQDKLAGAILVTTPQELSWQDVRKQIDFLHKTGIRLLGVVENMAGPWCCPECGHCQSVFAEAGVRQWTDDRGIALLGTLPLDPGIGQACDAGLPLAELCSEGSLREADEILKKVVDLINLETEC